jgi:hypothetical protein
VVDGRNLYGPDVMSAWGFAYYSVDRITAAPEAAGGGPLKKLKKS